VVVVVVVVAVVVVVVVVVELELELELCDGKRDIPGEDPPPLTRAAARFSAMMPWRIGRGDLVETMHDKQIVPPAERLYQNYAVHAHQV